MSRIDSFIRELIHYGTLHVILPNGEKHTYKGKVGEEEATIRFHNRKILARIIADADLALGEGYMNGEVTFPDHGLTRFMSMVQRNRERYYELNLRKNKWREFRIRMRALMLRNFRRAARSNVEHHYSLSNTFFRQFLDADMQYSCGYYSPTVLGGLPSTATASNSSHLGQKAHGVLRPASDVAASEVLDAAQRAKKQHIINKLAIDGQTRSVLDIGCGWGGLMLSLCDQFPQLARVEGVTLSTQQHVLAEARIAEAQQADRAKALLKDYRDLDQTYDRVVSVGMFEHIGRQQIPIYFQKLRQLLAPNGVALVHSIVAPRAGGGSHPWINKYIFPGGYIPSATEVLPAIEASGLYLCDVEVWRMHYAETLRAWRYRTIAKRDEIIEQFDERFFRMWHYYLAACEELFNIGGAVVHQWVITRSPDVLPLSREYVYKPPV